MRLTAALVFSAITMPAVCDELTVVHGKPEVQTDGTVRLLCAHEKNDPGADEHCKAAEIRLFGISMPEWKATCFFPVFDGKIGYRCGVTARAQLMRIVDVYSVSCQPIERERHGRLVAWCVLPDGETDVAELLVRRGWASVDRTQQKLHPERLAHYAAAEALARDESLGLWRGEFQATAKRRADRNE